MYDDRSVQVERNTSMGYHQLGGVGSGNFGHSGGAGGPGNPGGSTGGGGFHGTSEKVLRSILKVGIVPGGQGNDNSDEVHLSGDFTNAVAFGYAPARADQGGRIAIFRVMVPDNEINKLGRTESLFTTARVKPEWIVGYALSKGTVGASHFSGDAGDSNSWQWFDASGVETNWERLKTHSSYYYVPIVITEEDELVTRKPKANGFKQLGGVGSGNFGHGGGVGGAGNPGGSQGGGGGSSGRDLSSVEIRPKGAEVVYADRLNTPAGAEKAFVSNLLRAYPATNVPIFHESPIANLDSINKNGLTVGESAEGTVFGTIGQPSGFVSGDRIIVQFSVKHRDIIPDQRYDSDNPAKDLLTEHKGVFGADVAVDSYIPRDKIDRIYVVRGEKIVETIDGV
jgi:hypothetical protein